jgi:hypothetical protein
MLFSLIAIAVIVLIALYFILLHRFTVTLSVINIFQGSSYPVYEVISPTGQSVSLSKLYCRKGNTFVKCEPLYLGDTISFKVSGLVGLSTIHDLNGSNIIVGSIVRANITTNETTNTQEHTP